MPLIEGIGDEVTILASVFILATTLLIAWLSTSVSDRSNVRVTSPASASGDGENVVSPTDSRIEDVIFDSQWSGGTEITRTEHNSSTVTGAGSDVSQTTRNENELDESVESGLNQPEAERTTHSAQSQLESASGESSPSSVVRNRLTGHTLPTSVDDTDSHSIPTSTSVSQKDSDQLGDAAQTVGEAAQADEVLEERPSSPQEGQSEEQTNDDGPGQPAEGSICIRIKYLTDRERVVHAHPSETLGVFRQRTFSDEISSGQSVRLIFNGHLLQDDASSLSDLNLTQNCVVHCLLSQSAAPSDSAADVHEADVDLSRFMVPLFTCILGFVWYLRWQYRYMFNATSTLSLVGVTTLFVLAVLASWRG